MSGFIDSYTKDHKLKLLVICCDCIGLHAGLRGSILKGSLVVTHEMQMISWAWYHIVDAGEELLVKVELTVIAFLVMKKWEKKKEIKKKLVELLINLLSSPL